MYNLSEVFSALHAKSFKERLLSACDLMSERLKTHEPLIETKVIFSVPFLFYHLLGKIMNDSESRSCDIIFITFFWSYGLLYGLNLSIITLI